MKMTKGTAWKEAFENGKVLNVGMFSDATSEPTKKPLDQHVRISGNAMEFSLLRQMQEQVPMFFPL